MELKKMLSGIAVFAIVCLTILAFVQGDNEQHSPFIFTRVREEQREPVLVDQRLEGYDSFLLGSFVADDALVNYLNQLLDADFCNLCFEHADAANIANQAAHLINHYSVKHLIIGIGVQSGNSFETSERTAEEIISFSDNLVSQSWTWSSERDLEPIANPNTYRDVYQDHFTELSMQDYQYDKAWIAALSEVQLLCAASGTELTVVIEPVFRSVWAVLDKDAVNDFKRNLSEITNYWDFSVSELSFESRYFYDMFHCRSAVTKMMFGRLFADTGIYIPDDFGIWTTSDSVDETIKACEQPRESNYSAKVPILMYHHLASRTRGSDEIITPATFDKHLQAIAEAGGHTVTIDDLYRFVYYGEDLPENPVLITFDDGYLSNYELALPILERYGMNAVSFAIGAYIGANTYKKTGIEITPHYNYDQINELLNGGVIDVQSHTYDMHQRAEFEAVQPARLNILRFEDESESAYATVLQADLVTYQSEYAKKTGRELIALSYPHGYYDSLAEQVIHDAGIPITLTAGNGCTNTLVKGLPQTLYALGRLGVTEKTRISSILDYVFAQ